MRSVQTNASPSFSDPVGNGPSQFDPANYFDNKELIRAPRAIHSLDVGLFGDQVNLYRGGLEFVQTDVSLEGSFKIPVAVTRRLTTGGMGNLGFGLFNEWDLEIPHIHGTFLTNAGWVKASGAGTTNQRCTNFGAPPDVPYTQSNPGWRAIEFWRGNMLTVPGAGTQEILRRSASNNNIPSDGQATPLVTEGNWAIRCISSLASASGSTPYAEQGEGFLAISPDGTRYRFDWLVSRPAGSLSKQANMAGAHMSANRSEVWILPTLITDRFGNTVTYTYDTTDKWRVTSIAASDGRQITFNYVSGTRRIQSIFDGTRTWSYTYAPLPSNGVAPTILQLVNVTLPDGSAWDFHGLSTPNGYQTLNAGLIFMDLEYPTESGSWADITECDTGLYLANGFVSVAGTASMKHPSGAVGTFTLTPMEHGRNGVDAACYSDGIPNSVGKAFASRFSTNFALTQKTITGPGLPSMTWTYDYDTWYPSWNDGTGWVGHVATITVTDPKLNVTRHTFGNRYNVDEGKPLKVEVFNGSSTLLRTITTQYNTSFSAVGVSDQKSGDGLLNSRPMPVSQRKISQQGTDFTWLATSYDGMARPTAVTKSSSLGYSRSESTTYFDQTSIWVLGQVGTVTSGGLTVFENNYNPSTATLSSNRRFGVFQASYGYNTDGTLASRTNGRNYTTYLNDYKLGIPRTVTFPAGYNRSAQVNNIGLITSVTDEASYTTGYGYDAVGRLASITPPGGFAGTSLVFELVNGTEYGVGAGHWRQTISKGGARAITYLDALWRPVMMRTFDATSAATEAATRKVVVKQFDAEGRTTYESYPARDIGVYNAMPGGVQTSYDALGRPTQTVVSSELGNISSSTNYPNGFLTQATNLRGKVTTQGFWALDDPNAAQLASIAAPEGVSVSISRDMFGKPTAITRSGTSVNTNAGYASSVTRRYVYDAGQRLCRTIEPEVGSTIQVYDAASNVTWKAPGQSVPDNGLCNEGYVADVAKISYGYDALNRLETVGYGDASPGVTRTYTPDGLLATVTSNGSTWTYGYNALRKPYSESLVYAGQTYGIGWAYNTQGNLNALTYPAAVSLGYGVNALGEIESISGYASGITYHPNGAVAGYTLNNGIAHTLTQNTRGLPWVNTDAGVMQDVYAYDANGNITGIVDQQEGVSTRSMTYDDLDRLASASAPNVWGNATYKYDTVDNLRSAVVGSRSTAIDVNASNQVFNVSTNGAPTSYAFDPRGNLSNKGAQSFGFDLSNRLSGSSAGGSYAYDGLGRRIKISSSDGSTRIQVYSQAGQILWATSTGGPRPTSTTAYIYLGGKQIAESNSASGTQYVHTDALGSPVAHTGPTGALINRSRFEPYGYVAAGTKPSANTSVIGFTGHVQDAETDLVYMQQRYYDPMAGRFLSVDPIVTDANTGAGFGLYTYVDNNPYAKTDPDGRSPIDIAFLAYDVVKLGVAISSGAGVGAAAADVGLSLLGTISPVPGTGQALKGLRTAEHAIEGYRAAGKAREAVTEAKLVAEHGKDAVQREQYLRDAAGSIMKGPDGTARRIDHVVIENGKAVKSVETTSLTASKTSQAAKEQAIRDAGGTFVRDRSTGKLVDFKEVPTKIERVN